MNTDTFRRVAPEWLKRLLASRACLVGLRTVTGSWADGFVHAGNLAYLSLLTLFPFFIVVAALAGAVGRTDAGLQAVRSFLATVPPDVAKLVAQPIADVLTARSGAGMLTIGLLVTLWTVSGFIETIREIIRKAYGTSGQLPVWRYRIGSILLIVVAVLAMLAAFLAQIALTAVEQFVYRLLPAAQQAMQVVGFSRAAPSLVLFGALYAVFYALTPHRFRTGKFPIWPGALLTTSVWVGALLLLPVIIGSFGGYSLTYGSLAGVIVALLFFYIVGLGLVVGAHLNAALALVPKSDQSSAR